MSQPMVVKLGGDALQSPERIAREARRVARLAGRGPVVAVVSARRGVTDHLLGLVDGVLAAVGGTSRAHAEADRAVATGEVVTAALVALALNELGVEAVSLDAREAGVRATGEFGRARIRAVAANRVRERLERGIVPVITGFQGWQDGRVTTLGRGGTDASAVALAVALGASRVIFVKDAPGLRTADPRLVPDTRPIPLASHRFLVALAAAGASVVQADAARLAARRGVPLEFHSLDGDEPLTAVAGDSDDGPLWAVAATRAAAGEVAVTALVPDPDGRGGRTDPLLRVLADHGLPTFSARRHARGLRVIVPESAAGTAVLALHQALASWGERRSAPRLPAGILVSPGAAP